MSRCPTCGAAGYEGPLEQLARWNAARDAFVAAWPRLHCPACRKRLSPQFDSIDATDAGPAVRMLCHHCDHRFQVPRSGPG